MTITDALDLSGRYHLSASFILHFASSWARAFDTTPENISRDEINEMLEQHREQLLNEVKVGDLTFTRQGDPHMTPRDC